MRERLTRFVYEIGFFLFGVFYLPFFFIKGRHRGGFSARLGRVPSVVRRELEGRQVIWIHAVSVGESIQAIRLVNALRERVKNARFLLTTVTAAGQEVIKKLKSDEDFAFYLPIDFRVFVRRFIRDIHPGVVILLETEIWPNLIFESAERNIPVFIVNGRISDKAIGKYQKVKYFLGPVLNRLRGIDVQDETMKHRFIALGAKPDLVSVTGNMKFDWEPSSHHDAVVEIVQQRFLDARSFLCIAGSTHEGEEEKLFDVYHSIRARFPYFTLLVAPRHLERLQAIENKARQAGMVLRKLSALVQEGARVRDENASGEGLFVLDRMGILAGLYRIADVVFIGGSLVRGGGHNLVEPAFFGKAILFGPFMNNFAEMAEVFKRAQAAVEVRNSADLEKELIFLMQNPEQRKALGTAAKRLVFRHQGATRRNLEMILSAVV